MTFWAISYKDIDDAKRVDIVEADFVMLDQETFIQFRSRNVEEPVALYAKYNVWGILQVPDPREEQKSESKPS